MGAIVQMSGGRDPERRAAKPTRLQLHRGETVFGQEAPAEDLFEVVSGVVRTARLNSEGRRQVTAFYFKGDVFGMEPGGLRRCAAETVTDTTLLRWSRRGLESQAQSDGRAANRLRSMLARALDSADDRVFLFGLRSAEEKLAGFLVRMARKAELGEHLDLPMSRYDIADYLGLTVETVSRTFSLFVRRGLIRLHGPQRVEVLDPRRLRALAGEDFPNGPQRWSASA